MANLTGQQISNTYGNVVTIGSAGGTPTTGTIENGAGQDITDLTVNGTVNATTIAGTTGNITTVNATTVSATTLNGNGIDISQLPTIRVEWQNTTPAYFNLSNGANNYIPWNDVSLNPTSAGTTYFQLVNSGSSPTDARIHVKFAGTYMFRAGVHLYDLYNNVDVLVSLRISGTSSGALTSFSQGLLADKKFAELSADQMIYGSKVLNVGSNYFTISVIPSANSPFPSDANEGRTYFEIIKLN